jgi:ornithine cyclodeaminase/alanine dehydrogenase-like protein (mu-crystallin family)
VKITKGYVKGAKELSKALTELKTETPAATAAAMYGAAQIIMVQAPENAPVLEGWLQSGGYVTKPSASTTGKASVDMGFGGPAEDYLVRQHETHKTKAGYFARAIMSEAKRAEAFMAKFMAGFFRTRRFSMPEKNVPETPIEEKGAVKPR